MMNSGGIFLDSSGYGNMFIPNTEPFFRGVNMEELAKKRPFYSSVDELYDEEYYDEQVPEKKRRLTPEQVLMLEESFDGENKLESERKSQLAKKLGLQPRQVAVWFQNRRARWKTKQLERDYEQLKSSYDSLYSNFHSILKDNEKLNAEVAALTEKLQAKEVAREPSPEPKPDPLPVNVPDVTAMQIFNGKVEDRLSTLSGGSAVVDDEGTLQLVDSSTGDSYFLSGGYTRCVVDGVHSEEDSDVGVGVGGNSFSGVVVAAEMQEQEEGGEASGWWFWS